MFCVWFVFVVVLVVACDGAVHFFCLVGYVGFRVVGVKLCGEISVLTPIFISNVYSAKYLA